MKKSLLLGAGVVAALGVVALPLSSYAVDTQNVTLNVTVGTGIQLAVDAGTKAVSMNSGEFNETLQTTATVSTNNANGYKITVIDQDNNNALTSAGNTIPAADGPLSAGTAGWGIKGGDIVDYKAVPAQGATALTLVNKGGTANGDTTAFTYGIATANTQASGIYADTVTFTATVNP